MTSVNYGEHSTPCASPTSNNDCIIFVGNLSVFVNKDILYTHFRKYGKIIKIKKIMNKEKTYLEYVFIEFANAAAVEAALALNETLFMGRLLR